MIDPSFATTGPQWQIGSIGSIDSTQDTDTGSGSGSGFSAMLGDSIKSLQNTQTQAAAASQSLADGTATDPTQVVMTVERAQLAMQLASQIRTKAVEAAQDIFHTTV